MLCVVSRPEDETSMVQVLVYDTTLRDGTQREGISLSVEDKLKITQILDDLGVAYIEGGWPGSNPKDAAFFEAVKTITLKHARIAAFGSTCRVGSQPADDDNIKALVDSETPVVTVVGKSSLFQVAEVLRTTPEENDRLGKEIAEKASAARGPTAVLIPLRGVSAIDREGQPFWWPGADAALFQSLRQWISPRVELIELDVHINDPAFAEAATHTLLRLMQKT